MVKLYFSDRVTRIYDSDDIRNDIDNKPPSLLSDGLDTLGVSRHATR